MITRLSISSHALEDQVGRYSTTAATWEEVTFPLGWGLAHSHKLRLFTMDGCEIRTHVG